MADVSLSGNRKGFKMDIKQLRAFLSVAEHLNFTKASEDLYQTQSSVSKIIKQLEDELDTQLFYRVPKIQLTDTGHELYKQATQLIKLTDNIPLEIQKLTKLKKGNIKIGIPPIIGASFFPRIIGEFKKLYPNIDIKLMEAGSKRIEEQLDQGELDIGILCSFPRYGDNYGMFHYIKSPLCLGVHVENPLSKKKTVNYKELKDEEFILFNKDFSLYDYIIGRCMDNEFEPKVICNSAQRDFIVEMVATNLGVTLLPQVICSTISRPEIKFIPLEDPPINLNLIIIWRKDRYVSYASKKWLEFAASKKDIELHLT